MRVVLGRSEQPYRLSTSVKSLHTCLQSYSNSALVPFCSQFYSTRRSYPVNLILSTVTSNSSHISKSQLNYSFDYIAPRNWNSFTRYCSTGPISSNFSKGLKTYIFGKPSFLHRYALLVCWISWIIQEKQFH